MTLADLLARERVLIPLKANTLTDAARRLSDAVVASGAAREAASLERILAAALPGDVVMAGPAFLFHLRTEAVPRVVVAVGVAPRPIRRDVEQGKEARIVLLILAPPRETSAYLQALGAFARAMGDEHVVEALLSATTPEDVLRADALRSVELPGHLTVRDVMVRGGITVRPDTTLGEASRRMIEHGVHALPVVSETNEVLGMVTHVELLRHLLPLYVKRMSSGAYRAVRATGEVAAAPDPHDMPVREVMDRSVLCVSEDQALSDVATMMINRNIDRFPVVREGALVGFLTRGDIVRRLLGP